MEVYLIYEITKREDKKSENNVPFVIYNSESEFVKDNSVVVTLLNIYKGCLFSVTCKELYDLYENSDLIDGMLTGDDDYSIIIYGHKRQEGLYMFPDVLVTQGKLYPFFIPKESYIKQVSNLEYILYHYRFFDGRDMEICKKIINEIGCKVFNIEHLRNILNVTDNQNLIIKQKLLGISYINDIKDVSLGYFSLDLKVVKISIVCGVDKNIDESVLFKQIFKRGYKFGLKDIPKGCKDCFTLYLDLHIDIDKIDCWFLEKGFLDALQYYGEWDKKDRI